MELKNKPIPIVEWFSTIQGEGPRIRPALFIRSALCCFTCSGFGCSLKAPDGTIVKGCDSIRAVSTKFKDNWKYISNYRDLIEMVKPGLKPYEREDRIKRDIVWTGGEPLIHWKTKVMQDTISYFISRGHHFTIETNAALDIDFFREYQKEIMFSMSVKLSHSGEVKDKRINIETITKIVENCPKSYLKFVINPKTWNEDFKEIIEILDELPYFVDVYLMPLGENQKQLQENTPFVVEKCVELGFNYTDRVHIRCWDTKPGV